MKMELDGYLSDESDFYGSYTERTEWSSRNRSFGIAHWLSLNTSSLTSRANARAKAHTVAKVDSNNQPLTNPSARQSYETVSEFCQRVAPSKTRLSSTIQWIWIHATKSETADEGTLSDAKEPSSRDLTRLIERGQELLSEFTLEKDKITRETSGTSSLTRTLNQSRNKLVTEIHELARACNVTSGKWMLFPQRSDIDSTWSTIAHATASNLLGSTSKVSPLSPDNPLICIYTRDFQDVADVKRVLQKIKQLGLCTKRIYYKPDVYTHLELNSGNEYAIKTSLYSSSEMLKIGK